MVTEGQESKQADIRFRIELREWPGVVVYIVRSSNDTEDYQVSLLDGVVSGCTCREKYHSSAKCYHQRDVQNAEDMRNISMCEGCGHMKHGHIEHYVCDQCAAQKAEQAVAHRSTSEKGTLNGASQGFSLLK